MRSLENPNSFLLQKVFRLETGLKNYRLSEQYIKWHDAVEPMISKNNIGLEYVTLYPLQNEWSTGKKASNASIGDNRKFIAADAITNQIEEGTMLAVVVDVHVQLGFEQQFIDATIKNCRSSLKEVNSILFLLDLNF